MNTTKGDSHGAVAGQVERGVRPLVDERGPLGTLRFELRKVLAACASERCAPEIGAKLDALLDAPQWDAAAATYHDFRRECNDTDAVLHVLGLDPVNCRTDGGSLKLVMLLGALEHRDVMTRREARRKEIERCADVIARKTHLPVTGDWDAGYVAGRDDAILAIRITASNAALDDACPSGKCTDPARDCYGSGCLSDEPQSAVAAAYGGLTQTAQG